MRLQPDGRTWTSQYRLEHESYVYSEEEIGSLCAKLVARTLAAKERLAVVADSLDLVELFESTRLPAAAGPDPAVEDPHEAAAGAIAARIAADEETERCAVAIQSVARGRRERARLARLRAEAAAEAEQAASAVRIQSLTGTTGPGGAGGGGGGATVWADDEAEAAVHIQRLARGKLARRKVAGLQRGGETITVRASGSEAAAERARAGDVAKVHDSDAAVAESEAVRAEEAREKEAAVIKIQAIARGRASRRAKQSKGPLTGKAAAMAAVEADVSGDKRAERAASGMVKQGQAAVMSEEDKAAARIQALHRGRLSRKQTDDAKLEARRKRKEEEEQRQQAIVRIQAAARGRAARRHVAVMAATE